MVCVPCLPSVVGAMTPPLFVPATPTVHTTRRRALRDSSRSTLSAFATARIMACIVMCRCTCGNPRGGRMSR